MKHDTTNGVTRAMSRSQGSQLWRHMKVLDITNMYTTYEHYILRIGQKLQAKVKYANRCMDRLTDREIVRQTQRPKNICFQSFDRGIKTILKLTYF